MEPPQTTLADMMELNNSRNWINAPGPGWGRWDSITKNNKDMNKKIKNLIEGKTETAILRTKMQSFEVRRRNEDWYDIREANRPGAFTEHTKQQFIAFVKRWKLT